MRARGSLNGRGWGRESMGSSRRSKSIACEEVGHCGCLWGAVVQCSTRHKGTSGHGNEDCGEMNSGESEGSSSR